MPNPSRPKSQDVPATQRLYLILNGALSVVVRGYHVADPLAKTLGVNCMRVDSLAHAHNVLRESYGEVPASALRVTSPAPAGTLPAAGGVPPAQPSTSDVIRRSLPWLRIETEEGVIDKTVTDPEQVEGLKSLRLWP